MLFLVIILVAAAVILLSIAVFPLVAGKISQLQFKKVNKAEAKLETMFIQADRKRLLLFYALSPLILAVAAFIITNSLIISFIAAGIGLIIPEIYLRALESNRRMRFSNQLVDGLMVMSSSLKAGLSLLQAIEVLTEEMPPPISQEFGLVLRENRMGITLEDSLKTMQLRMNIEELNLIITAILVARQTGGDLTKVLSRLTTTIRDNRKLKDSISTLTLQGRLQGIIMSALPFLFVGWVLSFNKGHFDIMLNSDKGRFLLILAVVLQVVGMFLIRKFSMIKF